MWRRCARDCELGHTSPACGEVPPKCAVVIELLSLIERGGSIAIAADDAAVDPV